MYERMTEMCLVALMMCASCKQEAPPGPFPKAVGASAPVAPPRQVSEHEDMSSHIEAPQVEELPEFERPAHVVSLSGEASTFIYEVRDARGEPVRLPEQVRRGVRNAMYPAVIADDFVVYDVASGKLFAHELSGETREVLRFSPHATTIWYGGAKGATLAFYESQPSCMRAECDKNVERHKEFISLSTLRAGAAPQTCTIQLEKLPQTTCASVCQPVKIEVLGAQTARYLVRGGLDDLDGAREYVTVTCGD